MPILIELEEVQLVLDELHARLQEIVGYGGIVVGCTQPGDMLHDFTVSMVAGAEVAQNAEMQLHGQMARLREALERLDAQAQAPPAPPPPPVEPERPRPNVSEPVGSAVAALPPPLPISAPPEPVAGPGPMPGPDFSGIEISNPTGQKGLVLVVDHDIKALHLAEALLTADDYRVIACRDGMAALEIYRRTGRFIDLVMIEVQMPQIGGEEIFGEIRALHPEAAVVVSGGFSEPAKVSAMLMKGLNGFIPKPYRQERLLRQINAVLSRRRRTTHVPPAPEDWRTYGGH